MYRKYASNSNKNEEDFDTSVRRMKLNLSRISHTSARYLNKEYVEPSITPIEFE